VHVDSAARRPKSRVRQRISLTFVGTLVGLSAFVLPAGAAHAVSPDQQKYNLAFATNPNDAAREAQLVNGEDERLIDVRIAGAAQQGVGTQRPYRVRTAGFYTLVLPTRRAPYTIDDLRTLMPQTFLHQHDGSYLLREHILVDQGATLALSPTKPTTIKMLSNAQGFASIVSTGGRLRFLGSASAPLTFESWDDSSNAVDTNVTDGRAYILAQGQLVSQYTNFNDLGFWSGRTGGLALTSSAGTDDASSFDSSTAGVDSTSGSSSSRQTEILPSGALPSDQQDNSIDSVVGTLTNTKIIGNAFGFFVTGASGMKMKNVTIQNSLIDGLILHRNVTNADIEQVLVTGSRGDGIVITRGVEGALISQVTASHNGRDGISITGTPLAKGPSVSGASIRQFGNNVLTASEVDSNARTGVRIVGGSKVRVLGNSITGGVQGLLIDAGADSVVVDANRFATIGGAGVQIRDATNIEVSGNSIRGANTGVHIQDASATIEDNTVAGATLHAVSLVGDVSGTKLTSNLLGGRGSSAIDQARRSGGDGPVLKGNDLSSWKRIITQDTVLSTLKHPLTVIWICVVLFIIIGQIAIRRYRKRNKVRTPYIDGPAKRLSAAAIEADQAAALTHVPLRSVHVDTSPNGMELHRITQAPVPEHAGSVPSWQTTRPAPGAAPSYQPYPQQAPNYAPQAPSYASAQASHNGQPGPSYNGQPAPSYSGQPAPGYNGQPAPAYNGQPGAEYNGQPAGGYNGQQAGQGYHGQDPDAGYNGQQAAQGYNGQHPDAGYNRQPGPEYGRQPAPGYNGQSAPANNGQPAAASYQQQPAQPPRYPAPDTPPAPWRVPVAQQEAPPAWQSDPAAGSQQGRPDQAGLVPSSSWQAAESDALPSRQVSERRAALAAAQEHAAAQAQQYAAQQAEQYAAQQAAYRQTPSSPAAANDGRGSGQPQDWSQPAPERNHDESRYDQGRYDENRYDETRYNENRHGSEHEYSQAQQSYPEDGGYDQESAASPAQGSVEPDDDTAAWLRRVGAL
jgi:hypothetical protein